MRSKFKWIFTLLVAFTMQFSFAQEKTVTGVVSDELGPIAGANVVVEGTTRGTTTDFDGNYTIKAKQGEVLVISYTGKKTTKITVAAANSYNVSLKDDVMQGTEVVVTAYGIVRETKKLAYSTEKVEAKQLTQASPVNAVTALAGKVSGLNIITRNNGVNPSTVVILRGYKGITGDNAALIVIDGVIQASNALNNLNPNDIESINTLKGASATALYGSQGRNGALIVTTKQGKKDTGMSVDFSSSMVVEKIKYFPEMQTSFGSGVGEYDPIENTSWGPRFDGNLRRLGPILSDGSYQLLPYKAIPDNRKNFFVDGVTKINTISLSGGDEKSTYFFSAQKSDITGITPKDEYGKNNFRLNVSRQMSDKFKVSTGVSFFTDKSNVVGDGGYQSRPIFWNVINTPANVPLTSYKDWRNNKFATPEGYYNQYYQNPYMIIDIARDKVTSNRLLGNVKFTYDFNKWFSASYSLAGTYFNSYDKKTRDAVTYNPDLAPGRVGSNTTASVAERTSSDRRINSDLLLTFKKEITKDLKGTLILGNALFDYKENNLNLGGTNLFVPELYNPSVRTGELTGSSSAFRERRVGWFADLTLDISNYLSLNGAYRIDQASTLPVNNNKFDFYTFGASLSMLDAIPSLKSDTFNFWKLNGSYSKTGYQPEIGFINELYTVPAGYPFGSTVGLATPTVGASTNFTPSFTKSYEFGTELEFFSKRLSVKANYFNTTTDNEFLRASTSTSSGISQLKLNSGSMESKGFELDLNASIIRNDNFEWKVGVNASKIKSEVLSLSEGAQRLQTGLVAGDGSVGVYAQVGQSFPSLYGTAYTRDDEGHIMLNANGDPIVSSELKYLGTTTPTLIMGFNTSVRYKQFTLSAVADYKTGHKYYNNLVDALEFTGSTQHSASAGREPFVFPNSVYEYTPGVWSENTNITTSDGGYNFWTNTYNAIKENYVVDATTLKLREVALNYDLPSKYLDRTFIKGISFGLVARNIIMLRSAQNKYTDPEFTTDSQQVTGFGTQNQLPPTASYGFKMDVKF